MRTWTLPLPRGWAVGSSKIHSALPITLALIACLFLGLSFRAGFEEFRSVALTIPLVWVASLIVRLAAQQLAIGEYSHDTETIVGPTGNLQTDYEFMPARAILAYALSSQLASLALISIGLVVGAAMTPDSANGISASELLDFRGGWGSRAWASQIMWVNVFLVVLNTLPTVPFDMRATGFACMSWRCRNAQEPHVFRRIALFDSHLAAIMLGVGATTAVTGWMMGQEILGWYAVVAAAVYLFVASKWEHARADELEEQYMPKPPRRIARQRSPTGVSNYTTEEADIAAELVAEQEAFEEDMQELDDLELSHEDPDDLQIDVDEILRKVHKGGVASLTDDEREALIIASRRMQDRRKP